MGVSVEIPYKIPKNVYECPRCHNRFLTFNKSLHDFHCTDQHPESLIDYQCPRYRNCFPLANKFFMIIDIPVNILVLLIFTIL